MSKRSIIKVENLHKTFEVPHEKVDSIKGHLLRFGKKLEKERIEPLNNISFNVKGGEFFGIIGRNGSGKSTLLKILGGIYRPVSGTVEVNGTVATFIELGVGFNPELSGRDNILLNGTISGLTRKQITEKFDEIVEFAELEEFIDQKIKNYSSGMKVRLAFSIAIQAEADILLVDEVLAVGDANFKRKCFSMFREYKESDKTVVFVSHDMDSISEFCDRAILLEGGKIAASGRPHNAITKYHKLTAEKAEKGEIASKRKVDNRQNIRVQKAWIEDEYGEKTSTLSEGRFNIVVQYQVDPSVGNINPGITIRDTVGQRLMAANANWIKKQVIPKSDNITVAFTLDNIFTDGYYRVNAGVTDGENREVYDLVEDVIEFYSERKFKTGSLVNPYYEIEVR